MIKSVGKSDERKMGGFPDIILQVLKIDKITPKPTVPLFEYVGNNLDEDKMYYYDYEFENVGHSEICELSFTTGMSKYFNIIAFDNRKFYIEEKIPNISVFVGDLFKKPGDKIMIRIYVSKELIEKGFIPNINIWILDPMDYVWMQTLDVRNGTVNNSRLDRYDFYKTEQDADAYISYIKESYEMCLKYNK